MFQLCLKCAGLNNSHPASESGRLLWCSSRCDRPGYTFVKTMADALVAQEAVQKKARRKGERRQPIEKHDPLKTFRRDLLTDGFARTIGKSDTMAVEWYYREATYRAAVEAKMEVPSWLEEDERGARCDYDEWLAVAMADRPDRY